MNEWTNSIILYRGISWYSWGFTRFSTFKSDKLLVFKRLSLTYVMSYFEYSQTFAGIIMKFEMFAQHFLARRQLCIWIVHSISIRINSIDWRNGSTLKLLLFILIFILIDRITWYFILSTYYYNICSTAIKMWHFRA